MGMYTAIRHPEWLVRRPDGTIEGVISTKTDFIRESVSIHHTLTF